MKKYLKYLIGVLLILILVSLVWYLISIKKNIQSQPTKNNVRAINNMPAVQVIDPSVMMPEERTKFYIKSNDKVEVISRNASGTPVVYKFLSDADIADQVKKNASIASNLKAADGLSLMSDEEKRVLALDHLAAYEVVSRNDNGSIASYRFLYFEEPKEIKPEFMSNEDKAIRGIPANMKIQILERNNDGEIVVYKVILKETNLVKKY